MKSLLTTVPDLIYALFGKRIKRSIIEDGHPLALYARLEIAKKISEDHYRPRGFIDLTAAFPDPESRLYYTWPDLGAIPTWRFNELTSLLRQAEDGMSKSDRKKIGEDVLRINDKILRAKGEKERSMLHAELAVLCKELLIEGAEVIPENVYYDMAAYCLVREDEDPQVKDSIIHLQKFAFLQSAGKKGADFFLHMPAFRELLRVWLTSVEGLMELLPIWSREKRRRQTIREVFERSHEEPRKTSSSSSAGSPTMTRPLTKP